jgi:hypothetical protein
MPPIALDAIAARTPAWSRVMAMLLRPGERRHHKCHGHGPEKTRGSGPIHSL